MFRARLLFPNNDENNSVSELQTFFQWKFESLITACNKPGLIAETTLRSLQQSDVAVTSILTVAMTATLLTKFQRSYRDAFPVNIISSADQRRVRQCRVPP